MPIKNKEQDAASSYAAAIDQVMRLFCTSAHGAPGVKECGSFDRALYAHMQLIHEVFDADGEACIQCAGEMVSNALLDNPGALLSRTKTVMKDLTHAARRISCALKLGFLCWWVAVCGWVWVAVVVAEVGVKMFKTCSLGDFILDGGGLVVDEAVVECRRNHVVFDVFLPHLVLIEQISKTKHNAILQVSIFHA